MKKQPAVASSSTPSPNKSGSSSSSEHKQFRKVETLVGVQLDLACENRDHALRVVGIFEELIQELETLDLGGD